MIIEIILLCITIGLLFQLLKKPSNYPPGLWGLPLIGHLPLFGSRTFHERVVDMRNQYGDVFIWRLGNQVKLFLMDYKLIEKHLNSEDFIDRPPLCTLSLFKDCGVISMNGSKWHQTRHFLIGVLSELVKSNGRLVSSIQYEAEDIIKEFKKVAGKPTPVPNQLSVADVNVIWQILASRRYEATDSEYIEYDNAFMKKMHLLMDYNSHLDRFTWLETILPKIIKDKLFKLNELNVLKKWFKEFMMKAIKESEDSLDENNPRDYIDHYLIEMKKPKTEENPHMSYDDLIGILIDINSAAGQTSATINWAIFYLIKFPEVQKKLQKDVDEILTGDQLATPEDKSRLNYTEAFIHETLRVSSFLPKGVPRISVRDLSIIGFFIPKGTVMHFSSKWCHQDPKYWKNPDNFEPERFLDDNGKFVVPKEAFIPFGSGNRKCIGETVAHMELLIFISSLVKNFEFASPLGKEIDISAIQSNYIIRAPKIDQNIIITCRK